jgi:hypothetical protein
MKREEIEARKERRTEGRKKAAAAGTVWSGEKMYHNF